MNDELVNLPDKSITQRIIDLSGTEEGFWLLIDYLKENNSLHSLESLVSALNQFPFKCSFYFALYVDLMSGILIDQINSRIKNINQSVLFYQRNEYYHYIFSGKDVFYRYKEEGSPTEEGFPLSLNNLEIFMDEKFRYSFPSDPNEGSLIETFIYFFHFSVIYHTPPPLRQNLLIEENIDYPQVIGFLIDAMLKMSNLQGKESCSLSEKYEYFVETMGPYLEGLKND